MLSHTHTHTHTHIHTTKPHTHHIKPHAHTHHQTTHVQACTHTHKHTSTHTISFMDALMHANHACKHIHIHTHTHTLNAHILVYRRNGVRHSYRPWRADVGYKQEAPHLTAGDKQHSQQVGFHTGIDSGSSVVILQRWSWWSDVLHVLYLILTV